MTTKFFAGLIGSALMLVPVAVVGTAALVATTTSASAVNNPIPGVDIIVRKNPGGIVVRTKTDARGNFGLGNLAPGTYTIELQSFSWGVSTGKRDPNPNESPRIIGILIGLLLPAVQKTVVSSQQTVSPGKSVSFPFTIQDTGPDVQAKTHRYIGTVTLLR